MISIEQLQAKVGEALKAKDQVTANAYRGLLVALQQLEKDQQLTEETFNKTVKSEIKKRQESIEAYQKGNRAELAEKEQAEHALLAALLPPQLSEAELQTIVDETVSQIGASGPQQMGQVVGAVMKKIGAQADGGTVSRLVKAKLAG